MLPPKPTNRHRPPECPGGQKQEVRVARGRQSSLDQQPYSPLRTTSDNKEFPLSPTDSAVASWRVCGQPQSAGFRVQTPQSSSGHCPRHPAAGGPDPLVGGLTFPPCGGDGDESKPGTQPEPSPDVSEGVLLSLQMSLPGLQNGSPRRRPG